MASMIKSDFIKRQLPNLATILVLGTFLAILGPLQTHRLGMPGVWFYWVGLMALGWASAAGVLATLGRLSEGWPPLAHYSLVSFLISIPVTLGVFLVHQLIASPFALSDMPLVFLLVWVISAGVTTISWLLHRSPTATETPGIARTLLDKLPPRLQRAPLLALQAEDHYLRVHTDAGDALILMRLGDAIAAVQGLDGRQTHRSWWVARVAVDAVARGDGRATLTLSNGVEAPVSRTHAPGLREAGWY